MLEPKSQNAYRDEIAESSEKGDMDRASPSQLDLEFWNAIRKSDDPSLYQAYLERNFQMERLQRSPRAA